MLGIYVHIPFCSSKCAYCDFVSTIDNTLVAPYVAALKSEIEMTSKLRRDTVDSVFFGGGTPGVLSADNFSSVMDCLRKNFNIVPDAEVTLETNPGVLTKERACAYLNAGVNRLSIGLQAVQDGLLSLLGRTHTAAQFDLAYQTARESGFKNINIDAIYGIPTQTPEEWEQTLYHILYLHPEHISTYALKLEKNTPMGNLVGGGRLQKPDDDAAAQMYITARKLLCRVGFTNYEISNFSRLGDECRHNLKYWTLKDYLGLGASAHSNIGNMRYSNYSDISRYIAQISSGALSYETGEAISVNERAREALMLLTRLKAGIDVKEFCEDFGTDITQTCAAGIDRAKKLGLIETQRNYIRPTEKGFLFQNRLASMLMDCI